MVGAHRQAWTWQDEWYGLTMTEIRRLEEETAKALALKMGQSKGDAPVLTHSPPGIDSLMFAGHQQQMLEHKQPESVSLNYGFHLNFS